MWFAAALSPGEGVWVSAFAIKSRGPPPQMPREGGEILSWASGPCSGTAVRNRGAAGDPARDQLKGEEAWRTRLPGLPPQPLRCSLPAFGLRHHHHHFPGSGQCVWSCSGRMLATAEALPGLQCSRPKRCLGGGGGCAGARACVDQTVEAIARSIASRWRSRPEGSFWLPSQISPRKRVVVAAGGGEAARCKSPQTSLHARPRPPEARRVWELLLLGSSQRPRRCHTWPGQLHPNTRPGGLEIAGVLTVYPASTPKLSINACCPRPSPLPQGRVQAVGQPRASILLTLLGLVTFFSAGPQFPRLYTGAKDRHHRFALRIQVKNDQMRSG